MIASNYCRALLFSVFYFLVYKRSEEWRGKPRLAPPFSIRFPPASWNSIRAESSQLRADSMAHWIASTAGCFTLVRLASPCLLLATYHLHLSIGCTVGLFMISLYPQGGGRLCTDSGFHFWILWCIVVGEKCICDSLLPDISWEWKQWQTNAVLSRRGSEKTVKQEFNQMAS